MVFLILLGLIGVLVALSAAYFEIKRKGINQELEKWEKAQQESAFEAFN
jgi:hypothetical protein